MRPMSNSRRIATYALFFASGGAGLVYEVVWSRLLRDVFGITAYAVAAVLATFLGGLALGAWLLGRQVDRTPTVLMGATLPAITRDVVARLGKVGTEVSALYALNTAGAVAGCLVAGFVLIRALGVHPTLWIAVAVNVAVGIGAFVLERRGDALPATPERAAPTESRSDVGLLLAVGL